MPQSSGYTKEESGNVIVVIVDPNQNTYYHHKIELEKCTY